MTTPDSNQPQLSQSSQISQSQAPQVNQPEYGQRYVPEYGQLKSNYPGWNPYPFGEPEKTQENTATSTTSSANIVNHVSVGANNRSEQNPQQARDKQQNPNIVNINGVPMQRINPDDPRSNPLYGHWDPNAILGFIISLFMTFPIFGVFLGVISMRRTKRFHMKGYGLAVAAVVLGTIMCVIQIWMWATGTSLTDVLTMMGNALGVDSSTISNIISQYS